MKKSLAVALLLFSAWCFYSSCRYDKIEPTLEGYPEEIGKIFSTSCAITGCHTTPDKDAAGGLDLSSWTTLFNGARNGSPVIPFSSKYSFLCYFINSYSDLGVISDSIGNKMPPDPAPALSRNDVSAIMTWINEGAPSNLGNLRFPNDASRKKIYTAMQAKDMVAIFDAESRQIMKYVKVGANDNVTELPHQIRISPDGQYWYVIFLQAQIVQRFRTFDDAFVGQASIGPGNWNTMSISPDGNHLFIADFNPAPLGGKVVHVNTATMSMTSAYGPLDSPHGTYFMQTDTVLYVTAQYGNFIYKFDFSNDPTYAFLDNPIVITLRTGALPSIASQFDAHEILFTPDESKYFVTCQKSNGVRIFNTANDSLLDSIPTGSFPQEMAISAARNLLFVTCQEDSTSSTVQPGEKGSVFVYNYQTGQPVTINNTNTAFDIRVYQPHGIAVDDASGKVYVASLNYSTTGPAPHHSTGGNERNGFVTIIDMNTMEFLNFMDSFGFPYIYKSEVLPFPYSMMSK
jgi:DNA-binding beta-propeller fold protein YncE